MRDTGFTAERLIALCFLVGSVVFTADGLLYLAENTQPAHAALYTIGSVCFSVGSAVLLARPSPVSTD
jgi:hypothetical protein